MVQRGQHLGFPLEAGQAVGVRRERLGQRIFSATSRPSCVSVACQTWPMPALAEEGGHVVVPEAGAYGEGHGLLETRDEPFYAQAVNGSTVWCRIAPTRRA